MIYAVNKRTKEHLVHGAPSLGRVAPCPEWYYVQADADGWIEWSGGECPLPGDQLCEVKVRGEGVPRGPKPAKVWAWDWMSMRSNDIIAYRPILDDKIQAPEWNGEGLPPVGVECKYRHKSGASADWCLCTVMGYYDEWAWLKSPSRIPHSVSVEIFEFRPIRTDREKWIDAASEAALKHGDALGNLYDALKSGDLPQP